ncbi:MAG TPA: DnaJ C-terminal domain-containing protein [Fibrobacteria bacterium]|nr:DnaJ C-terminal domain-containing protein [Fibrobacteria bacterium]
MEYKDYYKILGLQRGATQEEIKRAYKKLARKYHPDVSKEKNAEEKFKEVNEAHEVLKDPEKRAAYDRLGANWKAGQDFRPPPGWDSGFEFRGGGRGPHFHASGFEGMGGGAAFSDFFESLFGAGSPFGASFREGTQRAGAFKGEDHHARIQITLEDAFHGATRQVKLERPEVDGRGHVVTKAHTLNVKIPAGVTAGQQIRLPGQGAAGPGGGPTGDLYLEIEVAPHALFELKGRDIYLDLPVTPWEAALGATVSVPTLGGTVEVKVRPGARGGQKMRLKGRGLPGDPPGDQYLVIQVAVPPADTAAKRRLYEEMSQSMPFNPRADWRL